MPLNFFATAGFLALTLGAIATSSVLNTCSSPAQNQAQAPSPSATDAGKIPGGAANIGGFISHRLDAVLSGVRSAIAVKISGSELEQLRTLRQQVNDAMQSVEGVVDLQFEPQIPVEQMQL